MHGHVDALDRAPCCPIAHLAVTAQARQRALVVGEGGPITRLRAWERQAVEPDQGADNAHARQPNRPPASPPAAKPPTPRPGPRPARRRPVSRRAARLGRFSRAATQDVRLGSG